MAFTLTSPAFAAGSPIPRRCTCQGEDRSPPLRWDGTPAGTRSFALIVDDPDAPDPAAPRRVWVHWLAAGIPASVHALPEGAGNHGAEPPVAYGITDAGTEGYHGPCPPVGRHRYYFRLFALDTGPPDLAPGYRRADLERAMAGHVLAQAELMGTYQQG